MVRSRSRRNLYGVYGCEVGSVEFGDGRRLTMGWVENGCVDGCGERSPSGMCLRAVPMWASWGALTTVVLRAVKGTRKKSMPRCVGWVKTVRIRMSWRL